MGEVLGHRQTHGEDCTFAGAGAQVDATIMTEDDGPGQSQTQPAAGHTASAFAAIQLFPDVTSFFLGDSWAGALALLDVSSRVSPRGSMEADPTSFLWLSPTSRLSASPANSETSVAGTEKEVAG